VNNKQIEYFLKGGQCLFSFIFGKNAISNTVGLLIKNKLQWTTNKYYLKWGQCLFSFIFLSATSNTLGLLVSYSFPICFLFFLFISFSFQLIIPFFSIHLPLISIAFLSLFYSFPLVCYWFPLFSYLFPSVSKICFGVSRNCCVFFCFVHLCCFYNVFRCKMMRLWWWERSGALTHIDIFLIF
jgi:hypothetical protein